MNFNEEERNTYEDRLKWLMIEANTLKKAKEEGKVERSIEMAKKMLIKRKPMGEIMEFTDLTKEQIEELKTEIAESNK
ncbi:MAG: hypothetical protein ACRYE8_00085 [Janthinobacterium lividum]